MTKTRKIAGKERERRNKVSLKEREKEYMRDVEESWTQMTVKKKEEEKKEKKEG